MATGDPVAAGSEQITAPPPAAPEAPTGIQPAPDGVADPTRIPLPPMQPTPAVVPEAHKARVRFLDGVLVLLLLLFAFLCASFKATNSDLFMHLAAGRLIAEGSRKFDFDKYDLILMSGVKDPDAIPVGENLITVVYMEDVLHFRMFDESGKTVVDTDQKKLTSQAPQLEKIRKELESLWPPHELTRSEKLQIITSVASITGPTRADPFTYTAQGIWVNHSWLYDLVTYFLYSAGDWGGILLVVLKAILVTLTAALMLKAGSIVGHRQWIPAACTMLAVLAFSPRLLLQPHIVSMVLLALTLLLLIRPPSPRSLWYLPLVCFFWVNLDVWFFLGPLTILVYLAGEALQESQRRGQLAAATPPADLKRLSLVTLASWAACLVNPFHVYAFTVLPVGLVRTAATEPFRGDVFRGYFVTPFDQTFFTPGFGLSVAGLSFFVLFAVSLLSFLLTMVWNLDGLRYGRVFVWLAMTLLACWNTRAIPFFAVVAGPIAALNFLELTVKMLGAEPRPDRRWLRMAVTGRVLTIFAALALVAATVPGWLQSQPYHRRQVAWGVEVDSGLRQAAQTVASWREQKKLPEGQHWFNTSQEVVNYFAWFCPGEKFFVDGRLELFGGVAKDFVAVRRSLSGEDRPAVETGDPAPPAWRRVFADNDVSFLVFHTTDLAGSNWAQTSLERLFSNPDEFVPCYTDGSTTIFAWRDPRAGVFAGTERERKKQPPLDPRLEMDFNLRAFGPDAVKAPSQSPRPAGAGTWWERVLEVKGGTPAETLTAVQHLKRFEGSRLRYQMESERLFLGTMAVRLVGGGAGADGPLAVLTPARMCLSYNGRLFPEGDRSGIGAIAFDRLENFLRQTDNGPVASLYLAIRATREGLARSPDDVVSQLALAQAYNYLHYSTREYAATTFRRQGREIPVFPAVRFLRQTQTAAAAQSVLKVEHRPEQARLAHMLLAGVFRHPQSPYFESHVKHVKEVFRLTKVIGLPPGAPREQYGELMKQQEENVKNLDRELKSRRDQYEVEGSKFRKEEVLQRANLAVHQGLAETALNLLMTADPKLLRDANNPGEAPGVTLMINLLFGLGRLDEVRELMGGDAKSGAPMERRNLGLDPQGLPAFDWFMVQLGSATGDYAVADKHLEECIEAVRVSPFYTNMMVRLEIAPDGLLEKSGNAREFGGTLAGLTVLDGALEATRTPWYLVRAMPMKLFRARPPHPPKREEDHALHSGVRFLVDRLNAEADLWTLRAWLALEAGRVEDAREYAAKSLRLADVGTDGHGNRLMLQFRSQSLAVLVEGLAMNKGLRK